jgi:acyl carrier protein
MNAQEQQILAKIKAALADLFELNEAAIVPKAKLYEDLDIDSIDAVDLLIDLKKTIEVEISPEEFNEVKTIQDVVDVFTKLSTKA